MKTSNSGITMDLSQGLNGCSPQDKGGVDSERFSGSVPFAPADFSDDEGLVREPVLRETVVLQAGMSISCNGKIYTVERFIGRGGEAKAWAARASDGERVVLKASHAPWALRNVQALEEAIALRQRLTHIPDGRLARLTLVDGQSTLTLQNHAGDHDLESYLKSLSPLDRVKYLFHTALFSVLSTIGQMHFAPFSVVHRDLKPSNCVVANDGNICIVDTGHLAVHMGSVVAVMTPRYASPNTLGRAAPFTRQDDAYSLGMLVFRTLFDDALFLQFAPHVVAEIPVLQLHHGRGTFFSYGFEKPDFASHWAGRIADGFSEGDRDEVLVKAQSILSVGRALIADPTGEGVRVLREPESVLKADSGWTLAPSSLRSYLETPVKSKDPAEETESSNPTYLIEEGPNELHP